MKQFFLYSLAIIFSVISFSCISGKSLQSKIQLVEKNYKVWHSGMGRSRGIQFEIQYELNKTYTISEPTLTIGTHSFALKQKEINNTQWLTGNFSESKPGDHAIDFPEGGLFEMAPFSESTLSLKLNDKMVEIPVGSFTKKEQQHLIP